MCEIIVKMCLDGFYTLEKARFRSLLNFHPVSVVNGVSLATFGEACKVLCAEDWRYDPALGIKVRRDLPFSVSLLVLTSVYDTPVNLWHDWRKMMMSITVMS